MTKITVCSIDIGYRNLSVYVETFDLIEYSTNKSAYENGDVIFFNNFDLFDGLPTIPEKITGQQMPQNLLCNFNRLFDKNKHVWNGCDIFLIEEQVIPRYIPKMKTTIGNQPAIRLSYHCYAYFTFLYSRFKTILLFPSTKKTQVLGAPKKMTKSQRKKRSYDTAISIMLDRFEKNRDPKISECVKYITSGKNGKKHTNDDISDCILMIQAYKKEIKL